MSVLRYPFMFDNAHASASGIVAATASGIFATHRFEYEQTQALRQSSIPLTGADFAYDQLEGAPALKANGVERIRYLTVGDADDMNAAIDAAKAFQTYGRGRLWSQTSPGSGLRWAWARLAEMPALTFTVDNRSHAPVFLLFDRSSDWYDADAIGTDGQFSISADPDTITVTNPGNAPVYDAVITIKGPFSSPVVSNLTTGYALQSTSSGAGSSDWLRFDASRNAVEISADSGATWADDSANFVRAADQVRLMVMAAGANSVQVDGANGGDVVFDFSGAWH